jgi:hypothetical protein
MFTDTPDVLEIIPPGEANVPADPPLYWNTTCSIVEVPAAPLLAAVTRPKPSTVISALVYVPADVCVANQH